MTTPESNKEREWWEEKPFRKPIVLSAIERGIDAKFSYDIPAIIENQHRISVQACMEVVKEEWDAYTKERERAQSVKSPDTDDVARVLITNGGERACSLIMSRLHSLSALSEMKEKPV